MTKSISRDVIVGTRAERPAGNNPFGGAIPSPSPLYFCNDTGEIFQATGSGWTLVGQLSAPGPLAVGGGLTVAGTITSTNASVPTAAAAAGAGTSPPAPVVAGTANDTAGSITFGTGTSTAIGDVVTVTFGTALAAAPKAVIIVPNNSATAIKGPLYAGSLLTTSFTVGTAVATAASQGNTTYGFMYFVVQ